MIVKRQDLRIVNAVRKNAFKELKQAFIALIYALPHEEELQIRYIHKVMLQAEMMLNDTYGMTEKLLKQFRNYYSNMESLTAAQAVDVSYRILGEAIEEREKYAESGENKCAKEYMTVALSYIGEHLQEEELSIVQVATQIYLNPVYFGRVFKNTFHMTFKKYLLQQRMEKAKRLIQDGCESIGTVCEQVGISNASYFSHLFKEYTGKLPRRHVRRARNADSDSGRVLRLGRFGPAHQHHRTGAGTLQSVAAGLHDAHHHVRQAHAAEPRSAWGSEEALSDNRARHHHSAHGEDFRSAKLQPKRDRIRPQGHGCDRVLRSRAGTFASFRYGAAGNRCKKE